MTEASKVHTPIRYTARAKLIVLADVKLMMSLRDGLSHEVPLPNLDRVLANLEEAKAMTGDKAEGVSVEALSLVARKNSGLELYR